MFGLSTIHHYIENKTSLTLRRTFGVEIMLAKILTVAASPNIKVSFFEIAATLLAVAVSPWFYILVAVAAYYAYH
jgi:hypothetical protein